MKCEPIPEMSEEAVEAAIIRDQPDELILAVLSATLHGSDLEWAERVCRRLATHQNFSVRGNAILGFGHLARIHRRLDRSAVLPIVQAGLNDPHEYVRGQAASAADDIQQFLGWAVFRSSKYTKPSK